MDERAVSLGLVGCGKKKLSKAGIRHKERHRGRNKAQRDRGIIKAQRHKGIKRGTEA